MMKAIIKILVVAVSILLIYSCQKPEIKFTTSEDELIGQFVENNPENFSYFLEMLEYSGNLSFLNAYGTYTVFLPTNDAIKQYLEDHNYPDVKSIESNELKKIVRYHIIADTLSSTDFNDGKLPEPTMYGQYLTARAYFENNELVYKVNKKYNLKKLDIHLTNGNVHISDGVLEPVEKSVAQLIEEDGNYTIFTQALKLTGLYDTLNIMPEVDLASTDADIRWFTVFAHTDQTYENEDINDIDDLVDRFGTTGSTDHTVPTDSLYLYMAYHIVDNTLDYVADVISKQAYLTLAPLEAITIMVKNDSIKLNEAVFNNVFEKGSLLIRDLSDNTGGNGVFHNVDPTIYIKVRSPFRITWDVASTIPELTSLKGIYRTPGASVELPYGSLTGVTWSTDYPLKYNCYGPDETKANDNLVYNDWIFIYLREAIIKWIEFETPLIVKGQYKVWIGTRNVGGTQLYKNPKFRVFFDDEDLGVTITNTQYSGASSMTEDELLAVGYKQYTLDWADSTHYYNGFVHAQLAGTIDVAQTGIHKIKFVVTSNQMIETWLDVIEFIPVNEDQLWPRVDVNLNFVDKPENYTD